jgi:ribose transport system permease protein
MRVTGDVIQRVLAFGALIVLFTTFSLASENFFRFDNIIGILLATAVNGILALGVTFVITTGGIDLSVGTVMSLSAVVTAMAMVEWGLPIVVAVVLGVLAGATCGLVNGVMVAKLGLPPFIATLGMFYMARGAALIISDVRPIYINSAGFRDIATAKIVPGVPNAVLILFGAAAVAAVILNKTLLGHYTVAIGSNEEATRLSGVRTDRWKVAVYTLSGTFAGIAGVVIAARLSSAQPSLGVGYELDAIAAAVIGGTSLSGGEGTILGTVIGAFLISTLTNGLRILSVPQEWQTLITGAIVIVAVYLDVVRRRRQHST